MTLTPIYDLHIPELRHPIRTTLDRPERIFIAWHRQATVGVEQFVDAGRDQSGSPPQPDLWLVREYRRAVLMPDAAYYEPDADGRDR